MDRLAEYATARGIRRVTRNRMRRSVQILGEFLGREPEESDLDDRAANRWVAWLEGRYSPKSAREYRGDVLALWRFLADAGLVRPPWRVRLVRVPIRIPTAWTLDELRRLLLAAPGDLRILLSAAYQTGLRRGDLMSLEPSEIEADGTVRLTQSKTRQGHVARLDAATAAELRDLGPRPLRYGLKRLYRRLRELCDECGVRRGALQMTRRTGATQCEIAAPGSATRYLGHRTPELAARFYIDWSQVNKPVAPPRVT